MVPDPTTNFAFGEDEVAEQTLAAVEFRPTLVIGLGGSGHEVLVRLKARFLETFGQDIFKIVKLMAFDTDQKAIPVTNEMGSVVTLDFDTELIDIGHVPVSSLVNNLDVNPTIKAWLPKDKISVSSISAGAKQVRPLGRLALFYHYNQGAKIKDRLLGTIRSLGNIKLRGEQSSFVIPKSRGINVFIITSVCGGTGSGTFLDMAYVVREMIGFSGIPQEYCFVNGILVLPAAFANVAKDDVMANAYAALRELDYFSREGKFFVRYPDDTETTINARPFNICYLVDAVNENGKLLSGMEELAPMIAESVFIQTSSQVGQATKSVFDNVKSLDHSATTRDGKEVPTCYSSLGTSALVFPARRIISACAYRFGQQFIDTGLLGAATAAADDLAKGFIEGQKLPPKPLMVALSADANKTPILIRLSATPLGDVEAKDLLRSLKQMLANYEAQKVNRDYRLAVETNSAAMVKSVSQAIAQETVRLVDDPRFGPRQARSFLERLSKRFTELVNFLAQERGQITEKQKKAREQQPALEKALNDAVGSFAVGRKGRISKAQDEYMRSKEAELSGEFDIMVRNAAMKMLNELVKAADQQVKAVSALIDKLEQVKDRFQQNADELKRDRRMPFLTSDITSSDDVNAYYDSHKREVEQEATRFVTRFTSLYAWATRPTAEIARDVFEFVREPFMPISNTKLEQLLESRAGHKSPEQYLQDLRDDSVPFWSYMPARVGQAVDLESITVIGTEEISKSIFVDRIRKGETLTTTRDPHQVVVLNTKHGLPLFALTQMDMWQKKYEAHTARGISPLHLFPNLPWLQDIEKGKQYFALGEAFGFIVKKGVWYYCQRKDRRLDDARLVQGIEAAVERLLADTSLLREVEEMIMDKISSIGNDQAAIIIYDYEHRPRSSGAQSKTELELQMAAGKFREAMGYKENDVLAAKAKLGTASATP